MRFEHIQVVGGTAQHHIAFYGLMAVEYDMVIL